MLPTKYQGVATIDGERIPAELQLDAEHVRLALQQGEELIRWPLASLDVEPKRKGGYELKRGRESFAFEPSVDDGLGEEISLRRRFSPPEPASGPSRPTTVADRVREAGRGVHRRPALLEGRDLDMSTAGMVLGVLAVVVLIVAAVSGAFSSEPTTVVVTDRLVAPSSTPVSEPNATVSPTVAAATVSSLASVTTTPAPTTTAPPPTTTLTTTPTTSPPTTPPTTAPSIIGPAPSIFEMTPEQAIVQWDALASPLTGELIASDVSIGDDGFAFTSGGFVTVEGVVSDGTVSAVTLTGDPSGTVDDDRDVLTALGLTVAVVEPSLPPEGRRELLGNLGLDVADPRLDGLDGAFDYEGKAYSLRWDEEIERIIFQVVEG